jgi:DsbE subfamily thiol:disulfide oxidoreductase
MSKLRLTTFLPITIFLVLVGFFAYRLQLIGEGNAPNMIPSVMINRPAPSFALEPLFEGHAVVVTSDLKGHITLVNIFASWCVACRAEHGSLADVKKLGIILMGINYKDHAEDARSWLGKLGNPYDVIGMDKDGHVGIDFGVYGVPESYLIDQKGVIRYKQTGPLTAEDIDKKLLPLVRELSK